MTWINLLLVSLFDHIGRAVCVAQNHFLGGSFPAILIGYAIESALFVDDVEQTIKVQIFAIDGGSFVDGRAPVVHEFVQLSHKVILLLASLVIRALDVGTGFALVVDAARIVQAE